jgi:hypothetical protein
MIFRNYGIICELILVDLGFSMLNPIEGFGAMKLGDSNFSDAL